MILSRFEQDQLEKAKQSIRGGDTRWYEFKDVAVVSYQCYITRVYRDGMLPKEAATTPLKRHYKSIHVVDGIEATKKEHCSRLGFSYQTIAADCSKYGLTFEESIERRKKLCEKKKSTKQKK